MNLNFRHGIIRSNVNTFQLTLSNTVNIITSTTPLEVNITNGTNNYYHVEAENVLSAWTITPGTPSWLYIDLNAVTAQRTFGSSLLNQTVSATAPVSPPPVNNQHWFDTSTNKMKVYESLNGVWLEVIRIFVAYYNGSTVTRYSSDKISQINVSTSNKAGRILYDANGVALRKSDGSFITSETDFYTYGGVANTVRMESDITLAKAAETIPAFSVVAIKGYGDGTYPLIELADYTDVNETIIAICTENLAVGDITSLTTRGVIITDTWDWQGQSIPAGRRLWVGHGVNKGSLVAIDPYLTVNGLAKKPAVAKILSTNSVIFQQSFEDVGAQGVQGPVGASAQPATTSTIGSVKLSTASATPLAPVVVETSDPRLYDSRPPLAHQHNATDVLTAAFNAYPSSNVQSVLAAIDTAKLNTAGGTVTGNITLTATPSAGNHLVTKDFVTNAIATNNDSVVLKAGSVMTGFLTLSNNPLDPMHAATRQFVIQQDSFYVPLAGNPSNPMSGYLELVGDPIQPNHAVNKGYLETAIAELTENWTYVNADGLAANKQKLAVDTTAGIVTIKLPIPTAPEFGHNLWITDFADTFDVNKLVLDGNGYNVMGNPSFDVNVKSVMFLLLYIDNTIGWKIYPLGE